VPPSMKVLEKVQRHRPALRRGTRSRAFESNDHGRFWWHHLPGTGYVPPLYSELTDREWAIMRAWYKDTARVRMFGEINVPAMSLVQGLVMGNALSRVVQLGHFFGYSSLLVGFMLRAMDARPGLVSIDISQEATDFTQAWVDRAGLGDYVSLILGDSAAESSLEEASATLGGMPDLILLDSSHQYHHTLRELDLWVPRMKPDSLMLLHDTSTFAQTFDTAGAGGVQKALDDWLPAHPEAAYLNLNRQVAPDDNGADLAYKDGCGLGILQRLRS
jgi:predicted O-methyltransferase YrrM